MLDNSTTAQLVIQTRGELASYFTILDVLSFCLDCEFDSSFVTYCKSGRKAWIKGLSPEQVNVLT
jgi:hypothetical protein